MSGDDLKKVRPGDPLRIPAATYNRFIETARAQQEGRRLFGRTPGSAARSACIAPARNTSGEQAPMYAPVSIVGMEGEVARFAKPSEPPYGIALEPIAADRIGLLAVTGGPYLLLISGESEAISSGDRVAPMEGQWQAEKADGPFTALSARDGSGRAWVVFSVGGSPPIVQTLNFSCSYIPAGKHVDMVNFIVPPDKRLHVLTANVASYSGDQFAQWYVRLFASYSGGPASLVYETNQAILQVGSLDSPLATVNPDAKCVVRVDNDSQEKGYLTALLAFALSDYTGE